MSASQHQTWGGRFHEPLDEFVAQFTASVRFDQRLAHYDIQGSLAHAKMLAHCNLLTPDEAEKICGGLLLIQEEIDDNAFVWQDALEDVHMNIEARLTHLIGPLGKKLHTARSRNDQVATDMRLYLRDQIDHLSLQLQTLRLTLAQQAKRYAATIMPGFTHLQIAQPITFGHHLLAWQSMLARDQARLSDCRQRVNILPLGAAALAGTSYPIDRDYTAHLLGFSAPAENSLDAVSDRDFIIEFLACASLIMMHFSRFCEELILWSSTQFNFISLPDRFCTGSSIMPQKKNPDVPELIRGKTGRVYGHLMSLLTLMKSQPLAYNKDNQEDKEPVFDTVDTLRACSKALIAIVGAMGVESLVMAQAAQGGYSTATDLADYLVKKGLAFRDAHEISGRIVAFAIETQKGLSEISLAVLQSFSALIENDIYDVLTLEGSVNSRDHIGATAPAQVRAQAEKLLMRLQTPQEAL